MSFKFVFRVVKGRQKKNYIKEQGCWGRKQSDNPRGRWDREGDHDLL